MSLKGRGGKSTLLLILLTEILQDIVGGCLLLATDAGLGPLPRFFLLRGQKKESKEKTSPCPLIPRCDFIWARQKNSHCYALLKQLLLATQRFALLPKFSIATTDGQRAFVLHHHLNHV